MIQKSKLYFDSFSRFTAKQLYYWVLNKYIKKILPLGNPRMIRVSEDFGNNFQLVINNTSSLLCLDGGTFAWELGVSFSNTKHDYYDSLLSKLKLFSTNNDVSIIDSIWLIECEDHEETNNYQRFYLYCEALKEIPNSESLSFEIIESWINKNPPSKSNAWNSFNCSVRIINWLKMLLNTSRPYDFGWGKIQESIYVQAINVLKNIEYHIPGNHVVIQFFALWLVGNIFTDWKISGKLRKFSELKLQEEIDNQYLESGLHFEQSFHYHVQINLVCMYWLLAMKKTNRNPQNNILDTIRKAARLVNFFDFSQNMLPLVGDNCYNFFHKNLWEDIQNHKALNHLLFGKLNEGTNVTEIKNQYLVAGLGKTKLILDVGNIGLRENPGHGHADILSLLFSYDNKAIFVDPGTRKYRNEKTDLLVKKTISHNTLSVESEDQAKLWGFFRWGFLPDKSVYSFTSENDKINLTAEFYGFKHLGGYKHKREINLSTKEVEIIDSVIGHSKREVCLNFIIAPELDVVKSNNSVLISNNNIKIDIVIESKTKFKIEIIPFEIYQNYNQPVSTNKIQISFLDCSLPFDSKIRVIPYI